MIKNTLYVYEEDGYTLYFLYDAASSRWIGGRHFYNDEDVRVTDFMAIAKLFGVELKLHVIVDKYSIYEITKGEPIYNYRCIEIMYRPVEFDANCLIKKDCNPVLFREDIKNRRSGIPYIIVPLKYVDDSFVHAFIFDDNFAKFEIEYNIDTGEARNARRV